jgi:long-subunit fatty acid transport protein
MKWFARLITVLATVSASSAWAAGYDTPMLYSASHMGMGGTAIGSVDDASAIFHNPAGLSRSGLGALHLDVSPLGGVIQGSPDKDALSIKSNTAVSPFFMVGGAYNVWDRIHVGFAAYLLGGAAGSYDYNIDKTNAAGVTKTTKVKDSASLGFIEFAPALSVRIIDGLSLGVAWRPLFTTFERNRVNTLDANGAAPSDQTFIDMKMKGWAFTGFRVGLQYAIGKFLFGLVYRNKVSTTVKADSITYASVPFPNATYEFVLPSKLGFGVQWAGIEKLRLAADFEYIFNSENTTVNLIGEQGGVAKPIMNTYNWADSFTIRVGAGYHVTEPLEVRVGYVFDARAANPMYPTAFGSPPGPTHIATAGVGYAFTPAFDMSFAMAYRHGTGSTSEVDDKCPFCGKTGDYAITLIGAYLDARYHFGKVAAAAPVHAVPESVPAAEAATPSAP